MSTNTTPEEAAAMQAELESLRRLKVEHQRTSVRDAFKSYAAHLSDDDVDGLLDVLGITTEQLHADDVLDVERIALIAQQAAKFAPPADTTAPRFTLGDLTKNNSRGPSPRNYGDSRTAAYERTRAKFTPKGTK